MYNLNLNDKFVMCESIGECEKYVREFMRYCDLRPRQLNPYFGEVILGGIPIGKVNHLGRFIHR